MKTKTRGRPRRTRQQILEVIFWEVIQEKIEAGRRYKLGVRWHEDRVPDRLRCALRRRKDNPLSGAELRTFSGTISAMINHSQLFVRNPWPHGNRLLVPAVNDEDFSKPRPPKLVDFFAAWEK